VRRCSRALCAAVVVALLLAVPARPASAQSVGFHIDDFHVEMAVQRDGRVNVTEVIDVDFASEPHHGIFRNIQVRFEYEPKPSYERVYKISDVHVEATGISAHNEISEEGRSKIFKIGDADETETGKHTYTITYTIHGALNAFAEHDELYWNPLGFDSPVPIDHSSVVVTTPGGIREVRCFTGTYGSTTGCEHAQVVAPDRAEFTHDSTLFPGSGFTIAVALAKGEVSAAGLAPILDEKWSMARAFALTPATGGGSALLLAVVGYFVMRLVWRTGRDRRAGGVDGELVPMFGKDGEPVQYRPPGDARPAQIGVLIDETADPLDVTATIVDLGVRGFLTIEEVEKDGWFHKADWQLTRVKDDDAELETYERRLFNALFDGRSEVRLSELKNTFASDLHKVQDSLYADAVKRGWFAKRPDKVRAKFLALGILAVLAAGAVLIALAALTHAALIGVPLLIGALILLAAHSRMPARTAAGSAALAQAHGFRTYMATAEADRMKFAEEENIFAKYLPYAIVFKETDHWAKAFHDIYGDNPPPGMGWYTPYGSWNTFSFGHFASSMSSFSVQTSGTIVSTPSASGGSGFSGGGFSGGGGGGGGTGGW
jgi:uncharacterized protein (TIGR04222 family)